MVPELANYLIELLPSKKAPPGLSLRSSASVKSLLEAGILKEERPLDMVHDIMHKVMDFN